MESKMVLLLAAAVLLVAEAVHSWSHGNGNDFSLSSGMEANFGMSAAYSAPQSCGNDCTCTCNCLPRTNCGAQQRQRLRHPCPLCGVCSECADETISIRVKACLQMHTDPGSSMMCLQGAGVSSSTVRSLMAARNSPGFKALLD